MNCPRCQAPLPAGQDRCPACAAAAVPVEGALAPDLSRPPRAAVEPIRELPGKRRRERTWKDEVRERMDRRRQQVQGDERGDEALPLFPDPRAATPPAEQRSPAPPRRVERRPARNEGLSATRVTPPEPAASGAGATGGPSVLDTSPGARADERLRAHAPGHPDLDAVDLHGEARFDPRSLLDEGPGDETLDSPAALPGATGAAGRASPAGVDLRLRDPGVDDDAARASRRPPPEVSLDEPQEEDWPLDAPRAPVEARPLEHPAGPLERLQAALVDLGLLVGLAALVVYFSGRVAQVPLAGLRPAWPFLAAYVVFLALCYAAWFTGTTGQTVGKILLGLRVVDTGGRAPGYGLALLRVALGTLATLIAGLGLVTVFFDPARRGLHDRLLRTRVIAVRRA